MKKSIFVGYRALTFVALGVAVFMAWAWQHTAAAFQNGLADSKSIRVVEANTCSMEETASEKPHFSGCNSII